MNTIKEIKKIFSASEHDNTDLVIKTGIMDPANVLMLVPKKIDIKQEMLSHGYKRFDKIPTVDIDGYEFCRFSKEYLLNILKILTADTVLGESESITIGIKEGMPLIMENKYYGLILAPRFREDHETQYHEWYDSDLKNHWSVVKSEVV